MRARAQCPGLLLVETQTNLRRSGNPAVIGLEPLDRWLCVPAFQRVCLSSEPFRDLTYPLVKALHRHEAPGAGLQKTGETIDGPNRSFEPFLWQPRCRRLGALRPVALRPRLSAGLPFSNFKLDYIVGRAHRRRQGRIDNNRGGLCDMGRESGLQVALKRVE